MDCVVTTKDNETHRIEYVKEIRIHDFDLEVYSYDEFNDDLVCQFSCRKTDVKIVVML